MFKFKQKKLTGSTRNGGPKDVQIMVPLKYLSNFWRTLAMPSVNCEINFVLNWSVYCVISNSAANQATTFTKTDPKLYVPVVTSSTQDNAKLLQQLKSGFKQTINWNRYHSKTEPLILQTHIENFFLINQLKVILKHLKKFEKLQLVKEMTTQLVVC